MLNAPMTLFISYIGKARISGIVLAATLFPASINTNIRCFNAHAKQLRKLNLLKYFNFRSINRIFAI